MRTVPMQDFRLIVDGVERDLSNAVGFQQQEEEISYTSWYDSFERHVPGPQSFRVMYEDREVPWEPLRDSEWDQDSRTMTAWSLTDSPRMVRAKREAKLRRAMGRFARRWAWLHRRIEADQHDWTTDDRLFTEECYFPDPHSSVAQCLKCGEFVCIFCEPNRHERRDCPVKEVITP